MKLMLGEDEGGDGGLDEVKTGYHEGKRRSAFAISKVQWVTPLLPLKRVICLEGRHLPS